MYLKMTLGRSSISWQVFADPARTENGMSGKPSLAILGAKPRFKELLRVGQFYWPQWEKYEKASRDIFLRRFYTSQRFAGPLVVQFQRRLEEFLGVKHVIVVRNATNALMIATHTLGLQGKVIVPSWTFIATVQALIWSKCQPVFCDIDPETQQISIPSVRGLLDGGGIKGILGVHLWGGAVPVGELESLTEEYSIPLYYDAAQAFGCRVGERAIGTFGDAEVFSFQAANILNTAEGGCLATNDDTLASKFLAMRGDHMPGTGVSLQSATARLSEIQAAIGLLILDDFDRIRRNNKEQHRCYESHLNSVPGIRILKPSGVTTSNFQHLVGVIDPSKFGLTRDELLSVLKAENVAAERHFHQPSHSIRPFSEIALNPGQLRNTELAARGTFQLPIGDRLTLESIAQICDVIYEAHLRAECLRPVLAAPPAN
jgi:dTDP-4-amino-4,6-dideoxygalactose transaminase